MTGMVTARPAEPLRGSEELGRLREVPAQGVEQSALPMRVLGDSGERLAHAPKQDLSGLRRPQPSAQADHARCLSPRALESRRQVLASELLCRQRGTIEEVSAGVLLALDQLGRLVVGSQRAFPVAGLD